MKSAANPVVKTIPATKATASTSKSAARKQKLRVAAYCRVSTLQEEQECSYEAQVLHYTEYILRHEGWVLAGIFADEGISGTDTRKRDDFNRMISSCMEGRIDMIITKSISRFARNTLDCLNYIRLLREKQIPVYFEKENINTMDARGEVLITIMASLAQQESQSISQNVRMGIQYQFQQGKVRLNHSWFLGYTKDSEGNLVIVPEEAEIVKRVYSEFLAGKSPRRIALDLEADHILTGAGKEKWYDSTIRSMLTNEKYIGDALLQKYYTENFLTKKKIKNEGTLPQYYVENSHPPIILKETFLQVQEELKKRGRSDIPSGEDGRSRQYALSGILICGCCGSTYRRMQASGKNTCTVWRCKKRMQKGAPCEGRTVKEPDVHAAVLSVLNNLAHNKKLYKTKNKEVSRQLSRCREDINAYSRRICFLEDKICEQSILTEKYKAGQNSPGHSSEAIQYALDLTKAKEQKQSLIEESVQLANKETLLRNMLDFITSREKGRHFYPETVFDDTQMMVLLDKVTVLPGGYDIRFKAEGIID